MRHATSAITAAVIPRSSLGERTAPEPRSRDAWKSGGSPPPCGSSFPVLMARPHWSTRAPAGQELSRYFFTRS
jgi:hypothetical protein